MIGYDAFLSFFLFPPRIYRVYRVDYTAMSRVDVRKLLRLATMQRRLYRSRR